MDPEFGSWQHYIIAGEPGWYSARVLLPAICERQKSRPYSFFRRVPE